MAEGIEGAEALTAHLEKMLSKEKEHISHTYTVMAGTKEAFFAQHGTKLTGALATLVVALISHFFDAGGPPPLPPTVDVTIEMPAGQSSDAPE